MKQQNTEINVEPPAPFNMAMLFYYQLAKDILSPKDEAIRTNNIPAWHLCLKALYHKIVFRMTEDERKTAYDLLNRADHLINAASMSMSSHRKASRILSEIDIMLIGVMNKHHMIFPNIEFGDPFEKRLKDMGISVTDKKR